MFKEIRIVAKTVKTRIHFINSFELIIFNPNKPFRGPRIGVDKNLESLANRDGFSTPINRINPAMINIGLKIDTNIKSHWYSERK